MRGSETGDALFHERAGKTSALLTFRTSGILTAQEPDRISGVFNSVWSRKRLRVRCVKKRMFLL